MEKLKPYANLTIRVGGGDGGSSNNMRNARIDLGDSILYSGWCPTVPVSHLSQRPIYMFRFIFIKLMGCAVGSEKD